MSTKESKTWPSQLFKAVEKSIDSLPSNDQIRESIDAIDGLIAFLQQLRTQLAQQPPDEVRNDVIHATRMLCSFLTSYNSKPLFVSKPKSSPVRRSAENPTQIYRELNALSLDEIQKRLLEEDRYSLTDLRLLAKHLNIGIDKRMRRDDIADAIFKRGFANPRAYSDIGGKAAQKLTANTTVHDSNDPRQPRKSTPSDS